MKLNMLNILKIKGLNELIRKMDNPKDNIQVFDLYKILADKNDSLSLDDTLDGIHLTQKAYDKLKENLKKIL